MNFLFKQVLMFLYSVFLCVNIAVSMLKCHEDTFAFTVYVSVHDVRGHMTSFTRSKNGASFLDAVRVIFFFLLKI